MISYDGDDDVDADAPEITAAKPTAPKKELAPENKAAVDDVMKEMNNATGLQDVADSVKSDTNIAYNKILADAIEGCTEPAEAKKKLQTASKKISDDEKIVKGDWKRAILKDQYTGLLSVIEA